MSTILAVDVGFVATGLAVFEDQSIGVWKPVHVSCARTDLKATKRKRGARIADSDAERVQHASRTIIRVAREFGVCGLLVELPSGGAQGARANRCMGIATGMIAALAAALDLPVEWYTPGETRGALVKTKTVTKGQVIAAAEELHPGCLADFNKVEQEAIADAIATFYAGQGGTIVRMTAAA